MAQGKRMKFVVLVLFALPLAAQSVEPSRFVNLGVKPDVTSSRTLYRWSVAAVIGANAADVASSWKGREANPVLAGPGTQFGVTSVAVKSGFVAASLLVQHTVLRHRPDLYKKLSWINFG